MHTIPQQHIKDPLARAKLAGDFRLLLRGMIEMVV